jgi:hypothetical protein
MDDILETTLKTAPSLTIVAGLAVWLVSRFLGHMNDRDTQMEKVLQDLGDSCHDFQAKVTDTTTKTLDKTAEALDRNTSAMGANTEALRRLNN